MQVSYCNTYEKEIKGFNLCIVYCSVEEKQYYIDETVIYEGTK